MDVVVKYDDSSESQMPEVSNYILDNVSGTCKTCLSMSLNSLYISQDIKRILIDSLPAGANLVVRSFSYKYLSIAITYGKYRS